jgi:class 3 adenylate cyclase
LRGAAGAALLGLRQRKPAREEVLRRVRRATDRKCAGSRSRAFRRSEGGRAPAAHGDVLRGRFDGFVAKYMGDGVLIYFGYPQAHENDAESAVRAGLALVDAVAQIAAPERLRTRIGVATGLVVVGDLIGTGSAQEQTVIGETPNLAAWLQVLADPDSVVIAQSTRRLTGDLFDYADIGAVELKGFPEPISAYRVVRESAVESRFEALRARGAVPLIGRDEEIELLMRRWRKAACGVGQVLLLSGEPGIGKSRLAAVIAERLRDEPHLRLRCFCSPHHRDTALHPFVAQLKRAAGYRSDDTLELALRKLEDLLAQSSASSEDVALVAGLLSLPLGAQDPLLGLSP